MNKGGAKGAKGKQGREGNELHSRTMAEKVELRG